MGADDPHRLVGIVPAAGHAKRLQPLTGSKETYRIAGKPLMDHLIDRLRRAACTDIRVVTRPEKIDVITHAERKGLTVVRAHPSSVSRSLLAGLEGTDPEDIVLLGFPDTIWEPIDGFVRLLDALEGFEVALGLFHGHEPERSDVVEFAESGIVRSVEVKPPAPTTDWVWGMAAARRRCLDVLAHYPEPGAAFSSICSRGEVVGVPLSGPFDDLGTRAALEAYLHGREA
jgi:glucose-1-phosphate thymidylyltransferase